MSIPPKQKYYAGHVGQISGMTPAVSRPHEGRFAIVTNRWALDAMDVLVQQTTGQGRTVKSCGPGAATLALSLQSNLQVTVTTSPLTGEQLC